MISRCAVCSQGLGTMAGYNMQANGNGRGILSQNVSPESQKSPESITMAGTPRSSISTLMLSPFCLSRILHIPHVAGQHTGSSITEPILSCRATVLA